jgi:hypothetical protein
MNAGRPCPPPRGELPFAEMHCGKRTVEEKPAFPGKGQGSQEEATADGSDTGGRVSSDHVAFI